MKEQQEYYHFGEQFQSKGLAHAIAQAWSESSCVNIGRIYNPNVRAVVTLCPLYKPGILDESSLLIKEVSIAESRVSNKWLALQKVLGGMNQYLQRVGGALELTAVFANKGILFNGYPGEADYATISKHSTVYEEAVSTFCKKQGIAYIYNSYDNLSVPFPSFVNPTDDPPLLNKDGSVWMREESKMITQLNELGQKIALPFQIIDNKKNRTIVEKIRRIQGISCTGAFWLIAGYLAFDYRLPELTGENGVYIATERYEPLFGITNMTPGLKELPKVKIKA